MPNALVLAVTSEAGSVALAEAAVDFLLDQPVARFVDAERVLSQVDRVLDERLLERATAEHLRPFVDREIARARARGDTVGDWLTAEIKAELRSLAGRPIRLERRTVERFVKQDDVRSMIRTVVRDTLERFIQSVKTGDDGGAVGNIGRKAFGFANRASRGVLGSISSQIEARLTSAMNGFVANNLDGVLDKVVAVAVSPETQQQAARQAVRLFDQAMDLESKEVADRAATVPWDDLLEAVPGLVAYNLERDVVRAALLEEVEAALAVEGERAVRDLWADDAATSAVRAEAVEVLAGLLRDFGGSAGYAAWLDAHVKG